MVTRQKRLNEFSQEAPPFGTVELLCEDTRGTFVLPFPCSHRDNLWRNVDTGAIIDAKVLGWRDW